MQTASIRDKLHLVSDRTSEERKGSEFDGDRSPSQVIVNNGRNGRLCVAELLQSLFYTLRPEVYMISRYVRMYIYIYIHTYIYIYTQIYMYRFVVN